MQAVFSQLKGNDHVKRYLTRIVEKKAIPSSMLFAGPEGIGKSLFALALAKLLVGASDAQVEMRVNHGSHPDVHMYRPEGKIGMHSMDTMRQFSREVYQLPYASPWKVFIISDADRMLPSSANALLKTFEEPAEKSIIILLSSAPEKLLPTVLSRCQMIRFHGLSDEDIITFAMEHWDKNSEEAHAIALEATGSLGNASRLIVKEGREIRQQLLHQLARGKMSTYTELLQVAEGLANQVQQIQQGEALEARQSLLKHYPEVLTASQEEILEKDVEGIQALSSSQMASRLFTIVLGWYRDMHLLHTGGNRKYLFHPDFQEKIEQSLQRGELLPLEVVQKAISQSKLALERSTSLVYCLENLFLQLNFL